MGDISSGSSLNEYAEKNLAGTSVQDIVVTQLVPFGNHYKLIGDEQKREHSQPSLCDEYNSYLVQTCKTQLVDAVSTSRSPMPTHRPGPVNIIGFSKSRIILQFAPY